MCPAIPLWFRGSTRRAWSRWRVLEFFGRISYGLYLYHFMVFSGFDWLEARGVIRRPEMDEFWWLVVRFVVVGVLAVGIAWVSREYFEERFLRLKTRFS